MNDWWRGAVIYQIYPRSFQDSTGSGVGDLRGITARLDHVARLGADAIWLSPIFTSPMADMGYDVSDYTDVDPVFGTLADFDVLLARARELGLKVIIDQVLSHSSDQHAAFGRGHALDLAGVDADEQDLAAGARVGLHQRPDGGRDRLLLLLGVVGVAQQEARMQRVVFRFQPGDFPLHVLG